MSAAAKDRAVVDPITVEVISSALSSITEEMGEALVRASYSTNIKERRDCSTALFNTAGETLCQAEHIPMHLGSFIGIIPHILKRHPVAEMRPGDVFMGNDAYEGGGTHLPDIVLAEPVFVEDGGTSRIVAWAVNTAHHADFADRGHAHIFQEGIRIPPIRLYRAGELQKDVQELLLLNCQVPRERLSDLRAQMAANRLGVERMQALCAKYGTDTVLAAGDALLDYAERKMRAGIATIPDGTYRFEDLFDNPEIDRDLPMSCEIAVAGDEMRLHFEAPDQVRAGLNMVYTALLSTVYYAVKTVVDPTILPNAGLARPLAVTAREGSIVNCTAPAAVNGRIAACQRVVDLIHGALAQVVPERVIAACNGSVASATFVGTQPGTGEIWVYLETIGGGSGARHDKDGLDGVHVHMTNTSNLPAEALELEYPLTLLRYELVDGSGGCGTHRGGMGLRRVYRAEAECRLRVDGSRLRSAPWGLAGGLPGGMGGFVYGEGVAPFDHGSGVLRPGQVVEIVTPGAGGYGPPSGRTAAEVARDVAERRIDPGTARRVYGAS
ncbi:N-methylhydantoinase (ATP-hydrolyzing) small subunit [Roseomonas mucosa]|uniref:N-methylhydantoinase A/acetone carboxylase, beta subunit n=1 Tax=Roseomonas mucosa TaxID=207340 RepID=A0A379N004_9PROT|nr:MULTISPECIES: hydantoinase B/oxoprolinase family protein [Roseomonas]MBS5903988.1 hydantoinase B/oxoprolinase family protein [Acetobacteraceae bacterium]MCG7350676.1 hydantoinase B/oxoprolinase family protein [Roseomonas mucosa]MCG7357919.1 hydantoinase B/oxoprolinase family protein [Roseomonas mucosa]MDT8290311.1 hydantoinase B/oxoprolinase family protein [Roseomonas mucosa]MDT8295555.1 hydantoinase B/oxoprolinase family protein [Roseomonas mucosa]